MTIPDSVTSIADYGITQTRVTSLTIPNSLTALSKSMFGECLKLESVTLPNGLTAISERAFDRTGLKSIVIPDIKRFVNRIFSYMDAERKGVQVAAAMRI